MSSDLRNRTFHLFLGFHSFLIGLFPFFLPVYLLKHGYSLADISLFIGFTGVSFCLYLTLWDWWFRRIDFRLTLALSFAVELLLLALLVLTNTTPLWLLALVNGIYNGLFWMVQRNLFFAISSTTDTGRRFGNFQIFVTVVLKVGVFTGGVLLQSVGIGAILLVSTLISLLAMIMLREVKSDLLPDGLTQTAPLTLRSVLTFRDEKGSRLIFAIDGVFLYLESYFWLISLFLLVKQNFWQLGMLVILLAVVFTLLFYLIKNHIDRMPQQRIYVAGVGLYLVSWGLRGLLGEGVPVIQTYLMLIVIAFCTTFFRLAYNKRFFDIARKQGGYRYILQKSYLSQVFIALVFGGAGLLLASFVTLTNLPVIYLLAAVFSPLFLLYRQ